jgi:hypothetical protein
MVASSQLHTLERTLVSTKHQAVWRLKAGQIVFGKKEILLLTFNSQKDNNRVTANLLRNISIKNVFFLYVAPQSDRSILTYMLHNSSRWTIYLKSLAFKSLFGSDFQLKNSVHGQLFKSSNLFISTSILKPDFIIP